MLAKVAEKMAEDMKEEGIRQGVQQGIQRSIRKGIHQGIQLARRETARKMLTKGYPVDDAVEITGLSPDEVDALTGKGQ